MYGLCKNCVKKRPMSSVFRRHRSYDISLSYLAAIRSARASASSICLQKYSLPMHLSNPAFSIICIGCSLVCDKIRRIPFSGVTPESSAKAIDRGRAIIATIIPEITSLKNCGLYSCVFISSVGTFKLNSTPFFSS